MAPASSIRHPDWVGGQVGRLVGADQDGVEDAAVGHVHGEFPSALNHVVVGDDDALARVDDGTRAAGDRARLVLTRTGPLGLAQGGDLNHRRQGSFKAGGEGEDTALGVERHR